MKGLARDILSAVLIITLTALVLLALVGTAGAVKLPYQSFDNLHVGDCQYETDANLVLAQWPKAKITTSEVVHAWSAYGSAFEGQDVTSDGGQNWTLSGLWAGQNYLVDVGFAGHRAQSITELGTFSTSSPVTPTEQAALIAAADHGGLQVMVMGPGMDHTFAITGANATHLVEVDDGYVRHDTWSFFYWAYTSGVNAQNTMTFYSVVWA